VKILTIGCKKSQTLSFRPKSTFLLSQENAYVPHCHFERSEAEELALSEACPERSRMGRRKRRATSEEKKLLIVS